MIQTILYKLVHGRKIDKYHGKDSTIFKATCLRNTTNTGADIKGRTYSIVSFICRVLFLLDSYDDQGLSLHHIFSVSCTRTDMF